MKICVVSGIFHPEIGGPATHLYNLCLELAKRGNDVFVVAYGDLKENYSYPFSIKRISRKNHLLLRFFKFTLQVIKICKNCDLFYVDHYGAPVALANIFMHKPVVIRIASDFAWEFSSRHKFTLETILNFQKKKESFRAKLIKIIQLFYIKRADFVIAPSNYIKDMAIGWNVPKERIKIVRNAIDGAFRINISKEKAKKDLNLEGRVITVIARLIPLKGVDKLIEIMKDLSYDINLVIVGEGPEEENLKRLAGSLDIGGKIIFKGGLPRDKIPLYLKASDIFILNSETEGSPQVILEAMVSGVPIIATNVGGIPEIIENEKEGLLIERGSPAQLKTAIFRLLEDEQLKANIIKNAQNKVKLLPFGKMADEILGLFHYLVLKKKRKIVFQKQLAVLRNIFAFFTFYSGILWLIQAVINLASKREKVTILAYHRVADKSDFITEGMGGRNVSVNNFEKHILYLKKNYKIISLDDLIRHIKTGNNLPKKSAIITFDDGYQDIYTNAFPILKRYNVPANIFLISDFISGQKLMWLHRFYYPKEILSKNEESSIASGVYLSWEQVKEMSREGVSIGCHTVSHQILSELKEDEVKSEVLWAKNRLEEALEKPVLHFAYPFGENGSFTERTKDIVKEYGFLSACSRFEGINNRCSDSYALKRIGMGDCALPVFVSKLALNEILAIFRKG